jgi:DNA-directed RNA polymerase subunit RPC12/RpoP
MSMRCCAQPMQPFRKMSGEQGFRCDKCSGKLLVDTRGFTQCDLCSFWVVSHDVHRTPEQDGGDSIQQCDDCASKEWSEEDTEKKS